MSSGNHKGGWSDPEIGTIDGHTVMFSSGTGNNEGQTLLADINDKEEEKKDTFPAKEYHSGSDNDFFKPSNHNHYGAGGGYNNNAKDNGSYTGPGH